MNRSTLFQISQGFHYSKEVLINLLQLCKLRVVFLMLITAVVGMLLPVRWSELSIVRMIWAILGIGFASAAGAVFNHLLDRHIDIVMRRTQRRPLPQGRVTPKQALIFAVILAISSMIILISQVNTLTAILTFISMLGYAVIYTMFLKHTTPQNIVIGGLAGAAPPLLGWTAMTNQLHAYGLLLVLIIFVWTPPHFWALAIHRREEYAAANVPMLPVTHGVEFTQLNIFLYIILLTIVTVLPYLTGMSGLIYLISVMLLNLGFIYYGCAILFDWGNKPALKTFIYSIYYLCALFIALLIDHYCYFY